MSLACPECLKDLGPSEDFPGREGTMVHPNLLSLVYTIPKKQDEKPGYVMKYLPIEISTSLCFECIEGQIQAEKRETLLKPIYDCYKAETYWRMVEEQQKGKWCDSSDSRLWIDKHNQFQEKLKALKRTCVFCDSNVKNGFPFFRARVIDKVYSSQHLSGVFQFTNYSFSDMKTGMTNFLICFDDMQSHFPKCFKLLSYSLVGGQRNDPDFKPGPNELYISSEFEKAFESETGKSIDDITKEMILDNKGISNIRIIRKSREK